MTTDKVNSVLAHVGIHLKVRRPLDDEQPDGYLESDADYMQNNREALIALLEGGLENFAELIVRECAQQAAQMRHVYPHQAELTATTILAHFGVKP